MNTTMTAIRRSIYAAFFVCLAFLALPEPAHAGTLSNASLVANTYAAGATATYTFSYTIATGSPNMIIYALFPSGFNVNGLGSPLDTSKVTVTVNGVQKTINASGSWGCCTNSFVVRLQTASDAPADSNIVVTANGIVNPSTPGTYSAWTWIRTADSGGNAIDSWPSPLPSIVITAAAAATTKPASGAASVAAPFAKIGPLVPLLGAVKAGSTHGILWTANGGNVTGYRLSFSADGGKTYRKVAEGSNPFGGYYGWQVPKIATKQAKIKIELLDVGGAVLFTNESETFRIAQAKGPRLPPRIIERLKTLFERK